MYTPYILLQNLTWLKWTRLINNSRHCTEDCSVLLVIIVILVFLLPPLLQPWPLCVLLTRRGSLLGLRSAADPGVGTELSVAVVNAPILQSVCNVTKRENKLNFVLAWIFWWLSQAPMGSVGLHQGGIPSAAAAPPWSPVSDAAPGPRSS